MLDLGFVRAPRGAPSRTVAWPVSLFRVDVEDTVPGTLIDPFTLFLLDAAAGGPLDLGRLAPLSGLPQAFLTDRISAAQAKGWIGGDLRLTTLGESARTREPERIRQRGWMFQCRRTGGMLPAFSVRYPKGSWSDEEPLLLPPPASPEQAASSLQLQIRADRAWHQHRRRMSAGEERQEANGTDLLLEAEPAAEAEAAEITGDRRSSRLRVVGRGQWNEARVDVWAEIDKLLPEAEAITLRAGCPVGWRRDGARYLRILEQVEEGQALLADLRGEARDRYRARQSEAVDHRWAERLNQAQEEARAGLGPLPHGVEQELREQVKQSCRSRLGRERPTLALGQVRVVAEQVLMGLTDDPTLSDEASTAWAAAPTDKGRMRSEWMRSRIHRLLPEDDDGNGLAVPKELRGPLESWVKGPPFRPGPTHGVMLLIHPFALTALAPDNPAALRILATLQRQPGLWTDLHRVFSLSNAAHHGARSPEDRAQDGARLDESESLLRQILVACFPLSAPAASAPAVSTAAPAASPENAHPTAGYDDLHF